MIRAVRAGSEMFTRLTATVIISAPEASCAFTMTDGDEYLPVPTMRREVKVLSAIVKVSMTIAAKPPRLCRVSCLDRAFYPPPTKLTIST